jgi:tetratricopeptide (TPR) repeat protein
LAIREKVLGPDHRDVGESLNGLAGTYHAEDRDADAEPLYERSLAIAEKVLGPNHPDVAVSLNNLASLYTAQGRYADALPLEKRSLAISEKAHGPNHPDVAILLNNLAELYQDQGRYSDALPIVQRTISQDRAKGILALDVLYGSQSQKLIAPIQALESSYTVLQQSASSAAGEAVSKLAARFAAGSDELAQLVRKDQDLTAESDRLDKSIIAAISKPPAERNSSAEDRIRQRIEEIKSERNKLQDIFN